MKFQRVWSNPLVPSTLGLSQANVIKLVRSFPSRCGNRASRHLKPTLNEHQASRLSIQIYNSQNCTISGLTHNCIMEEITKDTLWNVTWPSPNLGSHKFQHNFTITSKCSISSVFFFFFISLYFHPLLLLIVKSNIES